jgi:hypothetical protein
MKPHLAEMLLDINYHGQDDRFRKTHPFPRTSNLHKRFSLIHVTTNGKSLTHIGVGL